QRRERNGRLGSPALRAALDRHEPAWVPAPVQPALLRHAAALVNLEVVGGGIVPIEIEIDAHAVEGPQVGVAAAGLYRRDIATVGMLALHGQVEEFVVVRQPHRRRILLTGVAESVLEPHGDGLLPARIFELAVEHWPRVGGAAAQKWLGTGAILASQPEFRQR